MISEAKKLEIIDWILHLKDVSIFQDLFRLKKITVAKSKSSKRKFGCGKGIFTYVADDFNEPLSDFNEYSK